MIIRLLMLIFVNVFFINSKIVKNISSEEKTSEFWIENGRKHINLKLNEKPITTKAKNIILVIGDGMGISTLTSARIYKNQQQVNNLLPDENLFFEDFPNVGLSKTYSVDRYVADSAATATAILTGVKTNSGIIGLSPSVKFNNCSTYISSNQKLTNVGEMFLTQKKSVGFVTTSSIVDATPAAMYASTPSRLWKNRVPRNCLAKDIALQFLEKSENFQVVLGGGRQHFIPKNESDPEYAGTTGSRQDGKNLINQWNRKFSGKWKDKAKFIYNSSEFNSVTSKSIEYLFGLFEPDHMKYEDQRTDDPTLEQMTIKAIEILSKNPNGYFLLVEGAKVDKAHHENKAKRAILETMELEKAVKAADRMSSETDTLIIITADHSHTLSVGSYLKRNVDIFGKNEGLIGGTLDKKGHTSLLYGNGPGYKNPRENITSETKFDGNTLYSSGIPISRATHGGEEVSVYARGPWGHLLKDIYEQSYIGHVMMYSSCSHLYENRDGCNISNCIIYNPITLILLIVFIYFGCGFYNNIL